MIPAPVLAAWRVRAPWRDDRQVAQDLLLSLLAIRVAAHPYLAARLVWRGGTCLHKLHLERPWRYSEDLDYVMVGEAPHASIRDALGEVVTGLGMQCERDEISGTRVNMWGGVEVPAVDASVRVKFEVRLNLFLDVNVLGVELVLFCSFCGIEICVCHDVYYYIVSPLLP